ncbi:MAG: prolipoprotein diacylglyceryl transferase [Clostridia bacterium]|nr:prolipoprotein diacylglyceryl transferase [Clostridia bacterium]
MYPHELFLGIHLYGVMIALGILACFLVLYFLGKNQNIAPSFIDFTFYNAIFAIAFGFFSATLFQATYNYIDNPEEGFTLGNGFTFIGGLIGGVATFLIVYFILRKKLSGTLLELLPIAPSCITIAHAFGRIGCAFAGCCYGMETDSAIAMYNHGAWRIPVQLYESTFLFILFGVLTILLVKKNFKQTMPIYLVAYGIFRFVIEYFRGDERGKLFGSDLISPSQFWSILMVVIGIALFFLLRYLYKKEELKKAETPTQKEEINEQA